MLQEAPLVLLASKFLYISYVHFLPSNHGKIKLWQQVMAKS